MSFRRLPFPTGLADNEIAVGIRLTPFADSPVRQLALAAGILLNLVALEGFQPSISPFTKRVTTCDWAEPQDKGIQELAFLNALRLNGHWWVSHWHSPF